MKAATRIKTLLAAAIAAVGLSAMAGVKYIDRSWDETTKTVVETEREIADGEYTSVTSLTTSFANGGWYVVDKDITVSSRITVRGTAHLILVDGKTLTAKKGIGVAKDVTLVIYGQGNDKGTLKATSSILVGSSGIGGGGTVTVNGGVVTATGGSNAPGIGGGSAGAGGTVTVNGGEVTATGGSSAAGIGGGRAGAGGTVTVNGGEVTAMGGDYGAGIGGGGGGNAGAGGTVTVNGGVVTATGGSSAAGIGGGSAGAGGTVTVNGGEVTAMGGNAGAGIGGGSGNAGAGGTVTVNGGVVTATGGSSAAGIGGGSVGAGGTVTVNGGVVTATGGIGGGAGIGGGGGGNAGAGGTVTVNGGVVTATGGRSAAGIGGGKGGVGGGTVKFCEGFIGKVYAGDSKERATEVMPEAYEQDHQDYAYVRILPPPGSEENPWQVGENATAWTNGVGTLTVEGTGVATNLPAAFDRDSITNAVVEDGITGIGARFFKDCYALNTVTLGTDVTTVGEKAFWFCMSLERIVIDNPKFEVASIDDAVVYRAAFDSEGKLYTIPSIKVSGYNEVLYGTDDLTDPGSWKPVEAGKTMEESGYHFFKFVLEQEAK